MMRVSVLGSALVLLLSMLAMEAPAQVLQLPTFSFATVSTTVSVPDQGSVFLGGIDRAADGRNEFGVPGITLPGFQSRSIGQDRSSTGMFVTATIHDFDAMDQALLNTPSSDVARTSFTARPALPTLVPDVPAGFASRATQRKAVNLAGNWQVEPAKPAPVSDLAVEQASRAARRAERNNEADAYFAHGQQAEADGKLNVAKIYYQMAVRRASGDLKQQAQARLDAVSGKTTAVAKNTP
jgi:hypothetical protein